MNIGSRLKQILEERNINVSQFAREAEIPAQTLYAMIKRDSNKADMDIMARILEALDMDLLEFLEMEPRKKKAVKKTAAKAPEAKAVVKPEPEARTTAELQSEPDADVEAQVEPEVQVESEPDADVEAQVEPEAHIEPEPVYRRRELEDYLL